MSAAVLGRSWSSFSSARLHWSNVTLRTGWNLCVHVLVILALTVFSLVGFCRRRRAFWIYHTLSLHVRSVLSLLRVSWESATLRVLTLLRISVIPLSITLPWNPRKLLLALRSAIAKTWLNQLIRSTSWSITWSEPHLLLVGILGSQLWLTGLNLVALLAHSFIWDVVVLFFIFFWLLLSQLQMLVDESWSELVLSNRRSQKFWNSAAKEIFLEDSSHTWSFWRVFDQHIS